MSFQPPCRTVGMWRSYATRARDKNSVVFTNRRPALGRDRLQASRQIDANTKARPADSREFHHGEACRRRLTVELFPSAVPLEDESLCRSTRRSNERHEFGQLKQHDLPSTATPIVAAKIRAFVSRDHCALRAIESHNRGRPFRALALPDP